MKKNINYLMQIITLICIPAMSLFFLILIADLLFLENNIVSNVYIQVIVVYGIPILVSLCILPMMMSKKKPKDIGLCRNKKIYQDLLVAFGCAIFIFLIIYGEIYNESNGAYVLQYIFVGIGEEIFFRAILYDYIKQICNSVLMATIIVALIFGILFHLDGGVVALLLVRIPLSIFFSYIYIKTGSLSIPIILHGLYDIII